MDMRPAWIDAKANMQWHLDLMLTYFSQLESKAKQGKARKAKKAVAELTELREKASCAGSTALDRPANRIQHR